VTTLNPEIPAFLTRFSETQVTKQILPFWTKQAMARNSGVLGVVDEKGEYCAEGLKGAVMNARALWSFSFAYMQTSDPRNFLSAAHCFEGFMEHFVDRQNGGIYWALDGNNQPADASKKLLAQTYTVYALSQYYLASQDPSALRLVHELTELIDTRYQREDGTYGSEFNCDWTETPSDEKKFTETCNQLHVLEALSQLYLIDPSQATANKMLGIIDLFLVHIFPASHHLSLKFDRNWQVTSAQRSFGHNMEAPWLVAFACSLLNDKVRLKLTNIQLKRLVDLTLDEGRHLSGSFYFGSDEQNNELDVMSWWPQTEASNALLWLYKDTGDKQYLNEVVDLWQEIKTKWVDQENGEWFSELDMNLQPAGNQNKADVWRSVYHTTRACFMLSRGLHALEITNNTLKKPKDSPVTHLTSLSLGFNF
jgi:mannobiose 2-epimerase